MNAWGKNKHKEMEQYRKILPAQCLFLIHWLQINLKLNWFVSQLSQRRIINACTQTVVLPRTFLVLIS